MELDSQLVHSSLGRPSFSLNSFPQLFITEEGSRKIVRECAVRLYNVIIEYAVISYEITMSEAMLRKYHQFDCPSVG